MSPVAQAESGRAANGSDTNLAFAPEPPAASARFRTLAEQLADPSVIVEYRPGACAYEYSETFGGPLGPRPVDAVRSALRNLGRRPETVRCDPDPASPQRAYLTTAQGEPLARISGLTPDQANDALISLFVSGWEPGANRAAGLGAGPTAAARMPNPAAPTAQARFL